MTLNLVIKGPDRREREGGEEMRRKRGVGEEGWQAVGRREAQLDEGPLWH